MADTKRKDVLRLDELRHEAVDAGKQAAFDLWQAKKQVSAAALAHEGAKASADRLVDEVRELRAVLSECAKQLAAMGADAHASRARALLPETEDE